MSTLVWSNNLTTNKEIRRFKVAINTACPLRCEYCFIDKDSGEIVSWESVQGLTRLLLSSPGDVKKLLIYGGEPFLKFDLVKEVALYARGQAGAAGKDLDLSICTSAALPIKSGRLEFLRDQRFFVSVSLDGRREDHDRRRVFQGGRGSWERIVPQLPAILDIIGKRRSMAIQCVHPDNVEGMLDNFQALVAMGFENVEIEVIHGFGWKAKKELFRPMLKKVLDWIWAEARAGRMRFLVCSLVPLMLKEGILLEDMCPFHSSMECYPDGNFSFYPFAFVDENERKRCSVGNAVDGIPVRFQNCSFDKASSICQTCTSDYYRNPVVNEGNDPYLRRTTMAREFMQKVALAARSDVKMRDYLREALVRCRIS